MGKVLGIDQGVASVGWGIIDTDSNKVIDAGVRLFNEANKLNNEGRRGFRSSRRVKRRRVHRRERLIECLKKHDLFFDGDLTDVNPYECRKKGLEEYLTIKELNCALFNISKHRGSSLETAEEENSSDNEASTKYQLATNDQLLKNGKYVCEIQLERYESAGKIRGINNNFRSKDYKKELDKILSNQTIDDSIKQEITDIIFTRRHFSDGPGSIKSQTPYGKIYNGDGTVIDMIEKMTGHCSIYPDELRAPKLAPSAELFNLLNDLNNLSIDDEKIEVSKKQELVKIALDKGGITPKKIASVLGVKLLDINGFRVDKKYEPLTTEMKGYKIFQKVFAEKGRTISYEDFELLDNIASILTKTKVIEERKKDLRQYLNDEDLIDMLANQTKFVGYHSLSFKALRELNDELYNSTDNQMQILTVSEKFRNRNRSSQKGKVKIAIDDEAILSPVALRSYRQAVKVINAARKRFGEFDSIVIETTRAKNSKEEKSNITELQKLNEEKNKIVEQRMLNYPNIKLNSKLREKILLYEEQEAKTGYTQEAINLDLLITDPYAYEVDHIIPISVSLDDSFNNKTLVTREENQQKGNLSPLMAFQSNKFEKGDINRYSAFINSLADNKRISKKKYANYMYAKDINKYENMKEFIARNLVDTSYANRLLLNTLQDYFKDNDIKTTVHTVKGSATSRFRKYLKLQKSREEDDSHHAIDALLVASIKKLSIYRDFFKRFSVIGKDIVFNRKTGEIVDNIIEDDLINQDDALMLKQIANFEVKKYSHMVDTKPNRGVADQTIYSTRIYDDNEYLIKKYRDIYDKKFVALANDIVNNSYQNKYLIARNDPESMRKLVEIVNYYYDQHKNDKEFVVIKKGKVDFKINPLYEHKELTGELIRKYSKKNDGPVIKSIKYIDGKLGSHIDISKNYNVTDKKVVLQQISAYRTDFYQEPDGMYKFLTVRYKDVHYRKNEGLYTIDEDWYKQEKERKKISEDAQFLFSMHHNELLRIEDDTRNSNYIFVATKSDGANVVELHTIDGHDEGRITPTIGKKTKLLAKLSSDPLGNIREITGSKLKLRFK